MIEELNCTDELQAKIAGPEYCGQILDTTPMGLFSRCALNTYQRQQRYVDCMYDVCLGTTRDVTRALCDALSSLASICRALRTPLPDNWRETTKCGKYMFCETFVC